MKKFQTLFLILATVCGVCLPLADALAEEPAATGEHAAPASSQNNAKGMMALAVAIGIGVAAFGGTFAQGKAAAAALEGIARNPNAAGKVFVPLLLSLALAESVVLLTWVLMLQMLGKI